ncbi:MAG: hypothetical protein A2Y14_01500 [Verrucomicrobia bacterium GWF2_51_19]|nr:MAG: hypothetical protein A2Y14_01500 [Verrucomicrobia bacterium GWF2_51_19]
MQNDVKIRWSPLDVPHVRHCTLWQIVHKAKHAFPTGLYELTTYERKDRFKMAYSKARGARATGAY